MTSIRFAFSNLFRRRFDVAGRRRINVETTSFGLLGGGSCRAGAYIWGEGVVVGSLWQFKTTVRTKFDSAENNLGVQFSNYVQLVAWNFMVTARLYNSKMARKQCCSRHMRSWRM